MTTEKGAGLLLQNLPPNTTASTPIAAPTADQRAHALEQFGYTPRQAAFIALVAVHSGYFVRRHWLKFSRRVHGHCTTDFFAALVAHGHARTIQARILIEDCLMQLAQRTAGLDAELVDQCAPRLLVGREGFALAARAIEREHQLAS